jgi:putative oxidoreductase
MRHRKKINTSTVLAGRRVGIEEVDDGIWIVSFMRYDLGYIDLEQRTLQSHTYGVVDTGGLSKVVPMGNSRHRTSCDSKAVHMSMLSIGLALAIRAVLVLLFLPFSALDKALDFRSAVAQAQEAMPNKAVATALIIVGLFVEVFMSAGVVSGIADRACALVLAGYCAVTALVWKQFWRPGDFWRSSKGKASVLFWDFWKNLALAAGFLLIVFGTDASSIAQFFAHPTIQSHPYRLTQEHVRP